MTIRSSKTKTGILMLAVMAVAGFSAATTTVSSRTLDLASPQDPIPVRHYVGLLSPQDPVQI